jgi:hypothetical protein
VVIRDKRFNPNSDESRPTGRLVMTDDVVNCVPCSDIDKCWIDYTTERRSPDIFLLTGSQSQSPASKLRLAFTSSSLSLGTSSLDLVTLPPTSSTTPETIHTTNPAPSAARRIHYRYILNKPKECIVHIRCASRARRLPRNCRTRRLLRRRRSRTGCSGGRISVSG